VIELDTELSPYRNLNGTSLLKPVYAWKFLEAIELVDIYEEE
jgi:hypothetical protein